jgi:hypothetical protein
MAKKKNEEPSSLFNYTPIAILVAGALAVGASVLYKPTAEEKVAYPAPYEREVEVAVVPEPTPAVPVDVAPEAVTPAPAPVVEEAPTPEPVPEVKEEPSKGVPSPIEWPVVEEPKVEPSLPQPVIEEPVVELPAIEVVQLPVKKPVEKKKKKVKKVVVVKEDSVQDIFGNNFMRGTGF